MTAPAWDAFARGWVDWALTALLDGSVALLVALLLWLPFRGRASARLGYALFLVVLARVALPFALPVPAWLGAVAPAGWIAGWIGAGAQPALAVAALTTGSALAPPPSAPAWPSWLCAAWLCGVALLSALHLRRRWSTAAVVRRARPPQPGELRADLAELCRRAGVRAPVRLLITDEIETPAAGGLWSPYVLMPAGLLAVLPARPLRWVLLHELAHIRRRDVPIALLQDAAAILLFFHPAVWIANRLLDEQRELACDAAALAASGVSRQACGDGFLSVVEWAQRHQRDAGAALAMFRPRDAIRMRLMHILKDRPKGRAQVALQVLFAALAGLLLLPSARATPEVQDPRGARDPQSARLQELEQSLRELEQQQAELLAKLRELRGELNGRGAVSFPLRGRVNARGGGAAEYDVEDDARSGKRAVVERSVRRAGRGVYVVEPDSDESESGGGANRAKEYVRARSGEAGVDAGVENRVWRTWRGEVRAQPQRRAPAAGGDVEVEVESDAPGKRLWRARAGFGGTATVNRRWAVGRGAASGGDDVEVIRERDIGTVEVAPEGGGAGGRATFRRAPVRTDVRTEPESGGEVRAEGGSASPAPRRRVMF